MPRGQVFNIATARTKAAELNPETDACGCHVRESEPDAGHAEGCVWQGVDDEGPCPDWRYEVRPTPNGAAARIEILDRFGESLGFL